MPTISMFYGIIIYMFFYDNKKHKLPHIHASYGDDDAVFSIEEGEILEGTFPKNKQKLVQAMDGDTQRRSHDRLAACGQRPKSFAYKAIGVIMKKVISVKPIEGKKVSVVFSDGMSGIFDVAPYIQSDFFKRLEDEAYFKQVRLFFSGIGWPEGQDLGPDTIEADLRVMQ